MKPHRHNTRVEAYAFGKLSPEDSRELLREAKDDSNLQELIHLYQLEYRGMELLFQQQLRKEMKKWEAKRKRQSFLSFRWKKYIKYYAAVAAGLFLLIISLLIFKPFASKPSKSELAVLYAPSFEGINTKRGETPEKEKDLGLLYLKESAFGDAISYFEGCVKDSPSDEVCKIYLAHSFFRQGLKLNDREDLLEAQRIYRELEDTSSLKNIKEDAEWRGILLSLALDEEIPIDKLNRIGNDSNHNFHQKALNVKDQLE